MTRYKEVGTINSVQEIPLDENLIISGRLDNGNNGWLWRMSGMFKRRENKIVFINEHDMPTTVDENTKINLKILTLEESE